MDPYRSPRLHPGITFRKVLGGIAMALAFCGLPAIAEAIVVDCDKGQKIGAKVNGTGATILIVVKGTCAENLVITRDDVTITTDNVTPVTIHALDPGQPTVRLDGAHRITIQGLLAGFTIGGGTFGVAASRGSTLDLSHCTVSGNSLNGVVASYGSTVSIDQCTIGPNTGNGAVAANSASLVITSSNVHSNTASGIVATRSSYIRVGQDLSGTLTVKAVTVTDNGGNGISITESSSGNVVGGIVQSSASTNLFVGRGSSGQIGVGSNNLLAGVTIRNGSRDGIGVEGGNATIVFSTITGNARAGILVTNAGSARIGILNGSTGYGANAVSGNGQNGIHLSDGGAAFIGGTTVDGNGTTVGLFGRFGIGVFGGASANLAGDNVISNNAETGIFVSRNGQALVGNAAFGLTTNNTISGNGGVGPTRGGVFAFQGGAIQLTNATISNNTGTAVQAFEAGVIELSGSTAVTVPGSGSTAGAVVQYGSTLRVRDTASIVSATSDGIQASNLAAVDIRDGNSIQGNGAFAVGIRCFNTSPMTAPAATLTGGNLANVTGTTGSNAGCNVFP